MAFLPALLAALGMAAPLARPQEAQPAGAAIVLPPKLVVAETATLAVVSGDGRLVAGAVVEFPAGGSVTTDATGRAAFRASQQPGVLLARLRGSTATASATVLAPPAITPDGVQVEHLPRVALLSEPFNVSGYGFRGEADGNRVFLGDRPALVVAASPVSLVVLPGPGSVPGPAQLLVEVGGRSPGPFSLTLVALELLPEKGRLEPGEKSKFRVRVRGTEQRLEVEVRNLTPEVLRLHSDVQRVTTRGGRENVATLHGVGLRAGDYSLRLRLIRFVTGLPDTEASRQHLLAAQAMAPEAWAARLLRVIAMLEESPQNALRVRTELEKMLAELPPGEFGRRLEAAWRALLGR